MRSTTPNLTKRSCTLPKGCKDLIDVLKPIANKTGWSKTQHPVRANGQIRAFDVELWDCRAGIKRLGFMRLAEALALAQSNGTDVIEVVSGRIPPRCFLMDFGMYQHWINFVAANPR